MCGRLVVTSSTSALLQAAGAERADEQRGPRYNLAPTQDVPAVLNAARDSLRWIRWGLVPPWARDLAAGARLINARSETAHEKPAFRHALERRRCVILADGFYEWKRAGGTGKQPWFIYRADREPLLIAGLWEVWRDSSTGREWTTCAILTMAPNELIQTLHDRMPVILPRERIQGWLAPDPQPSESWRAFFTPYPAERMRMHPVSPRVNSTANDTPDLLEPITALNRPKPNQLELF